MFSSLYSDGKIELYDVESNVPVLTNETNGEVSFMRWSSFENSSAMYSGKDCYIIWTLDLKTVVFLGIHTVST